MATLRYLWSYTIRCVWLPYVWLYDLRLFVADFWAIHVRNEFTRLRSERAGVLRDTSNTGRVAVVAIHPTDDSIPFTQNLLVALTANGFYVLVVYNKPMSAALQAAIVPHCHHLIERFSVGRDFGAYKRGLIWLKEQGKLSDADVVVLANDSMFYPSCISETVSDMLSLSEDWVTLFENFQFRHHAQSFFLLFRRPVFEFWRYHRDSTSVAWRPPDTPAEAQSKPFDRRCDSESRIDNAPPQSNARSRNYHKRFADRSLKARPMLQRYLRYDASYCECSRVHRKGIAGDDF